MAKIMMTSEPAALTAILREKSKTQAEVAAATQTSRKTIQRIVAGRPVKDTTLQKVADYLRVPLEHLLPKDGGHVGLRALMPNADLAKSAADADDTPWSRSILLREVDGEGLRVMCKDVYTSNVRWKIDSRVSKEVIHPLKELEGAISDLCDFWIVRTGEEYNNLGFQLRLIEKANRIDEIFAILAEHKLCVLGAKYIYWTVENGPFSLDYHSTIWLMLCIEQSSVSTKRVRVPRGSVPPPSAPADATVTYTVDGTKLDEDSYFEIPKEA